MDAPNSHRIQALEQTFRVFNRVSERLEASYHRLENRVTRLAANAISPVDVQQEQADSTHLHAILMALPAGVVVLDGSGRVQECNPVAIALLGEPLLGEVWTQVIGRAFAPRSDDGHEISLRDGRRVSISTCPLGTEPGQVLLLTDTTETRALQDKLSQHQRLIAMGEMAAGLAHQIRTPLATGLLFAAQLKSPSLDPETRTRAAQKVTDQLRQLEALIDDMLMYSRSGYYRDDEIDVDALINDLAEAVIPVCRHRGIELQIELQMESDAAGPRVQGNPRILHSALLNLASNAMQAMGQGGTLRLCARPGVCDTVELCVSDTGPGVPAEVRDKLFSPFFTTRSDGTGLGLAVVQAVARAHRGSVRLDSEVEQGSQFIVQLPLIPPSEIPAVGPSTQIVHPGVV